MFLKIISILDFTIIVLSLVFSIGLIFGMQKDPGNAGIGIVLLIISLNQVIYSAYSLFINNFFVNRFCLNSI